MPRRRPLVGFLLLFILAMSGGTAALLLQGKRAAGSAPDLGGPHRIERRGTRGPSTRRWGADAQGNRKVEVVPGPVGQPPGVLNPAELNVRVTAVGGRPPIAGAKVEANDIWSVWSGITDAAGICRFPGVEQGTVMISVSAPGYVTRSAGPNLAAGANPPIVVELPRAAVVEGTVVAAADGRPIAGASIHTSGENAGLSTTSDAAGRWKLEAGPAGSNVTILATAKGFAPRTATVNIPVVPEPHVTIDLRMEAAGGIVGVVRLPDGSPALGARVAAQAGPASATLPYGIVSGAVFTNPGGPRYATAAADGGFAFDDLEAGAVYTLYAARQDCAPAVGVEVLAPAGGPAANADLALRRAGRIVARWIGEEAGDLPKGEAVIDGLTTGVRETKRGAGEAIFVGLPPDRYRIVAESVGRRGFALHDLAEGEEAIVDLTIAGTCSLEGVVVDEAGRPVDGAPVAAIVPNRVGTRVFAGPGPQPAAQGVRPVAPRVAAVQWTQAGLGRVAASTTSDAAGNFRLTGLYDGEEVVVHAEAPGFAAQDSAPVTPPSVPLRVVLQRPGRIVGRLVLPPGVADPTRVHCTVSRGSALPQVLPWNGGALALDEAPGRIDLQFRAGPPRWHMTYHAARNGIEVPSGGTIDLGDILLEPAVALSGRVTDREGKSIETARLWAPVFPELPVGRDGSFHVTGLPPGPMTVIVRAEGYCASRATTDLREGAPPVAIVLERGGLVTGTVTDGRGWPFAGGRVVFLSSAGPMSSEGAGVDSHGRFAQRLLPGDYEVVLLRTMGGEALEKRAVTVGEGSTATIDFRVEAR